MSEKRKRLHMAHNIYSNPVLRETSGKFDGFSIDFRGIETPEATYWALCNWGMDLTAFKEEHPDARGCGAYGGLQNTIHGKTAIMAFWETFYDHDTKRHNATRVYPGGKDRAFGGEGEGTNYITNFEWDDNTWYRMVLRSWIDSERKTTFVGQWFQNMSNGEWSLISIFDTKLKDSFMKGGMSQFQENYSDRDSEPIRSFNIKNIFVKDLRDGEWKYINRSSLGIDDPLWKFKTAGTHEFGANCEYFFGSAGSEVENQEEYDSQRPINALFALPEKDVAICDKKLKKVAVKFRKIEGKALISLKKEKTTTPILSIKVNVKDEKTNIITNYEMTRPDKDCIDVCFGAEYEVTLKDIYGNEKTFIVK